MTCHTPQQHTRERGFSLIELVVVMALLSIITALVVSSGRGSQQPLRLVNNAYEVALLIREAQVSASSVLGGSSIAFNAPIVVRVEPDSNQMDMFVDNNDNGSIDVSETPLRTLALEPRIEVQGASLDGTSTGGAAVCIRFLRPTTTATLTECGDPTTHSSATITLGSTIDATTQNVEITRVGRISVP
jgi:prepilin-type N-terminal cleavage/methylation domain-containing protein